jgi:hypothetical protein
MWIDRKYKAPILCVGCTIIVGSIWIMFGRSVSKHPEIQDVCDVKEILTHDVIEIESVNDVSIIDQNTITSVDKTNSTETPIQEMEGLYNFFDVFSASLNNQYLEDDHEITKLPLPSTPILLQHRYNVSDKGTSYEKRGIAIEKWPMGMKIAQMLKKNSKIMDVSEVTNTVEIKETWSTVISQGENVPRLVHSEKLMSTRSYKLKGSGKIEDMESRSSNDSVKIDIVSDYDQVFVLPPMEILPNKMYTIDIDSFVNDLPAKWQEEAPKVKVVVVLRDHVLFDGQEAYMVEVEQLGYSMIDLNNKDIHGSKAIKSRHLAKGKYYISTDKGQILWSEMNIEVTDSSFSLFQGLTVINREELIPISSEY